MYLFCILEKYVGICGNALKLIKSYFSNRTQRVQIDDVLSDFANILMHVCTVVFGTFQCLSCDFLSSIINKLRSRTKVRDLGVTFDKFLNFDDHITAICRSTYFHIRNIGKIRLDPFQQNY